MASDAGDVVGDLLQVAATDGAGIERLEELCSFGFAVEELPGKMVVVEDFGPAEHIDGCRRGL
jgi:hypothetical protein